MNKYKNCQSCGMPLAKDPHGTEADGSASPKFCSHCYQGGVFTMPNLTVDQMKERVAGKLREFKFPGFLIPLFTRKVPKLERWKQS